MTKLQDDKSAAATAGKEREIAAGVPEAVGVNGADATLTGQTQAETRDPGLAPTDTGTGGLGGPGAHDVRDDVPGAGVPE